MCCQGEHIKLLRKLDSKPSDPLSSFFLLHLVLSSLVQIVLGFSFCLSSLHQVSPQVHQAATFILRVLPENRAESRAGTPSAMLRRTPSSAYCFASVLKLIIICLIKPPNFNFVPFPIFRVTSLPTILFSLKHSHRETHGGQQCWKWTTQTLMPRNQTLSAWACTQIHSQTGTETQMELTHRLEKKKVMNVLANEDKQDIYF